VSRHFDDLDAVLEFDASDELSATAFHLGLLSPLARVALGPLGPQEHRRSSDPCRSKSAAPSQRRIGFGGRCRLCPLRVVLFQANPDSPKPLCNLDRRDLCLSRRWFGAGRGRWDAGTQESLAGR